MELFDKTVLRLTTLVLLGEMIRAQETVFNVPSPDVLDRGRAYVETDQYFRSWETSSGSSAFFLGRAVYGLGSDVEIGLNVGPFDYLHAGAPFIDAAVKWRPVTVELGQAGESRGSYGLFVGDNLGVGVYGDREGMWHDYVYAAAYVVVPEWKTRFSAGPYFASENYFAPDARVGVQLTGEQPIPGCDGLELAADWFSGDGAAATVGFIWVHEALSLYAGYGFANQGRSDDLVTLEIGYGF